jgi:hypothetical protein
LVKVAWVPRLNPCGGGVCDPDYSVEGVGLRRDQVAGVVGAVLVATAWDARADDG